MTTLTEHQKELAARELCRLRGIDPDGPDDVRCLIGNLESSRLEIVQHIQVLLAIEHGRSSDA